MFISSWCYFSDCWLGNIFGYPGPCDRKETQSTGRTVSIATYATCTVWAVTSYIPFSFFPSLSNMGNAEKDITIPRHVWLYVKSFSICHFLFEKTILRLWSRTFALGPFSSSWRFQEFDCVFFLRQVFTILPWLVPNSWDPVLLLLSFPSKL